VRKYGDGRDLEVRTKEGFNNLGDATKVTLRPKGRTVVIDSSFGAPANTHDGATVAKAIELKEKSGEKQM
jgi:chaperonin GroEL